MPSDTRDVINEQRKKTRSRRDELQTLVNEWDPAGRLAAGAPRDVYDSIIDKLFTVLSRNATESDVAAFLEHEVNERFGVSVPQAVRFAAKALAWYRLSSDETR